jgi:hypothetical protein
VLACVISAVSCGDDGAAGTASAGGTASDSSGTATSGNTVGPTSAPDTSAGSQTASADTSATDSASTAGTDTTAPTSSATASTGSDATGSSGASASAEGDSSSSGGGPPATHHLMNSDQTECGDPLWCFYNGNVDVPAGDPIEGQECFVSPVAPPFELIEMHYIVASTHTDLEAFELRIFERDGGAPTDLIASIDATSVEASPVEHYYAFEPPIVIDTQEFCVGFGAFEPGLASSIGMAVDTASAVPDVSYVRMEGAGDCDIPDWEDASMHIPEPAGNWCMDATIRELR